jgi:hypothetical protein
MQIRPVLPRNNFVVLRAFGGTIISPMLPADYVVTWEELKNALGAHHIPEGLMERKLNEFLALTQGTRTILQYA